MLCYELCMNAISRAQSFRTHLTFYLTTRIFFSPSQPHYTPLTGARGSRLVRRKRKSAWMWFAARCLGASAARRASLSAVSASHHGFGSGCLFSPCDVQSALRPTPPFPTLLLTRSFRTPGPTFAVNLGAAAAAVGVRTVAGVAVKHVKLRAAHGAYRTLFSDQIRVKFRQALFGKDVKGSTVRLIVLTTATGSILYMLIDPVPVTGRKRLILFNDIDEQKLGEVAAAALFQAEGGNFLPPSDRRTQRVAAVAWQLVNRLDFSDLLDASDAMDVAICTATLNEFLRYNPSTKKDEHPMFRESGGTPWTVHVLNDSSVNAFTCPGGHIFVSTGTLQMIGPTDDNSLAFILAHEMGHTLCRHGAEKATVESLTSVANLISWATALVVGAEYFGGAFTAAALVGAENAVSLSVTLPNSRDMEREADLIGVRLCKRACFDAEKGSAKVFQLLEELNELNSSDLPSSQKRVVEYLSTHPLDDQRAEATRAEAAAIDKSSGSVTQRKKDCAYFIDAVARCTGFSFTQNPLPPNFSKRNFGKVVAPGNTWRTRFKKNVDTKIAESPRGVTGALDVVSRRNNSGNNSGNTEDGSDHGNALVGSGPVGRFDHGRLKSIASGFGRSETAEKRSEKKRFQELKHGKTVSVSRGWRGPVRRAREIAEIDIEQSGGGLGKTENIITSKNEKNNADPVDDDEVLFVHKRRRIPRGVKHALRNASRVGKGA